MLPEIFLGLSKLYKAISGRITALHMKEQVIRVLRVWESWSVYPSQFLASLEKIFEGTDSQPAAVHSVDSGTTPLSQPQNERTRNSEDYEPGVDDMDDGIDGIPLDAAPQVPPVPDAELDGVPLNTTATTETTEQQRTAPSSSPPPPRQPKKPQLGSWTVVEDPIA